AATSPTNGLDVLVGVRPGSRFLRENEQRGRIWGEVDLPASLDSLSWSKLRAQVSQIPFSIDDNAGRPEIDASLTSNNLSFETSDTGFMRLAGDVLVERSRWLRDVQQGAAVLSFADPAPETGEPLPEMVNGIELDLNLQTSAPARSDINVLEGVEARAAISVDGTIGNPEITGTLDIERG